ncbi:hypothetical protein [Xanthomonas vesicatoria]|uniref:DUF4124 domain-containing protein n=1 Tax=Xanthomonas vesicatoria TaxID=56460 RepID=A0AAJ0IXZ1_9XANT|nr:hypothetical protein [Xanthomonas vesicatoria]APO95365.1 hypothetical protein BI313_12875 [Xanthomonas vesicatoria]KHM92027.1 hypothetical protein OR60_17855 [Xanthomonas vesicatoria]KHM94376.1 hypothetical protein OR61_11785 [Xanthomonas vesicatoria]KTF35104.1 hypothetical protein LMG919_13930 [Xanthomonas vesicatoria]MCC8560123.1 DUF4124 domain-containing protein [Xanthomonas vesicatoria]
MRLLPTLLLLACALPALAASTAAKPDPNVRVYRCVSSTGTVALQDAPCSSGRQQVLDMQRPQDPPPRPQRVEAPTPVPAAPSREVRIVTVQPPQPMYECTTEEGERYTSDSPEGNPRWVPTWGPAYVGNTAGPPISSGGIQRPPIPVSPRPAIAAQGTAGRGSIRGSASFSGGGYQDGYHGGGYGGTVIVPYGNVQIRDECHALPEQEVCARLADRRWELIRRYNSALQSERQELSREQRGIEARQQRDCGGA